MARLLALLGADFLAIGISGKYAVDIAACVVCCVFAAIALLYRAFARKGEV
jgi:hypothetical protein